MLLNSFNVDDLEPCHYSATPDNTNVDDLEPCHYSATPDNTNVDDLELCHYSASPDNTLIQSNGASYGECFKLICHPQFYFMCTYRR